ncbi:glycoside hydrolase family 130 protein [Candidatus Bipolaricaulota sp. J31]
MPFAVEERLRRKAKAALTEKRGMRAPRTEDLFSRVSLFGPKDFKVENFPHKEPVAAFNPGAALVDDRVLIFPRLVFDYYSYVSSIGVVELPIEALLSGDVERPLPTRIVLWPQYGWEAVKGCEDPRVMVVDDGFLLLYTAVGEFPEDHKERHKAVLGYAELGRDFAVRRKGFFSVRGPEGTFVPGNKDSAFIRLQGKRAVMLTRPSFWELPDARLEPLFSLLELEPPKRPLPDMCWRAEADMQELVIFEESLEPVLVPEPWEHKVGWSTNVLPLSEGEYLVGWHGVLREDRSYREGLALVDEAGQLRAVSDYLLAPKGLWEEYGDRPMVIFGNGLLRYGETLIWIGGVSDCSIGIFTAELGDVLSMLRRV